MWEFPCTLGKYSGFSLPFYSVFIQFDWSLSIVCQPVYRCNIASLSQLCVWISMHAWEVWLFSVAFLHVVFLFRIFIQFNWFLSIVWQPVYRLKIASLSQLCFYGNSPRWNPVLSRTPSECHAGSKELNYKFSFVLQL